MKKLIIPLSFVIILIFAGCKETPTQPLDTSVIWPLEVGNYWQIKSTNFYGDIDTNIILVDRDTVDNNIIKYHLPITFSENLFNSHYCYNNQSGLMESFGDYSILIYKYPAKINDTYEYVYTTSTVRSTDVIVIVPAGTFKCYEYQIESNPSGFINYCFSIVYLSSGIGPIKIEKYSYITGDTLLVEIEELISYKIY